MNRDNPRSLLRKRVRLEDIEDDDNLNVKIKKENVDGSEDPCISGMLDAIEFKDHLVDDLTFEQLTGGSNDVKILVTIVNTMAAEIKSLTKEVREIRNILEERLTAANVITPEQSFANKYMLDLPLKTLEEFDAFDERLKEDQEFFKDFGQSLGVLYNPDDTLTKVITTMLRRYLSRELAMKFTATKASALKLVFKETTFCACLFDVLLQLHKKDPTKGPLYGKRFYSALSSVLPNAKDWDGCRSLRTTPRIGMEADGSRNNGDGPEDDGD